MLKKGGIFLSILLCATLSFAQDKTAEIFRSDNPNLMNLDENKEYEGSPLVYIDGVKAPEKATNDMEALQLKLFGTKNIQKATKNTLELSPTQLPEAPSNQIQNFTFENPFHQTIQAGFIRHIPAFFVLIQVLDRQHIRITESITLMNTEEKAYWSQQIPLSDHTLAQSLSYTQNGQSYPITQEDSQGILSIQSPIPLDIGPNRLSFTYQLQNPFNRDSLSLDLTGPNISWPIETFKTTILFPTNPNIQESKLIFGNNNMDIPEIYTQQMDTNSNVNFEINRIVPSNAIVRMQMKLDPQKLPPSESDSTTTFILFWGSSLLILYWALFGWWEHHKMNRATLPQIRYPHTLLALATQMETSLTEAKWQSIIEFGEENNWPLDKVFNEYNKWKLNPQKELLKAKFKNFIALAGEALVGTIILLIILMIVYYHATNAFLIFIPLLFSAGAALALIMLYNLSLKRSRKIYWQRKLKQLSEEQILSRITPQQIRHIYPLFILAQGQEIWRRNLAKANPKTAQEVHLAE